ncbi:MAG TPA: GIY-YIG nuclease family protein, partial [Chroococcales cyanobacterium]
MSFYAYVLECKNGAFYTGWTNDIDCRVRLHFEGKGAKYTRANPPVKLAAKWQFDSKIEAMQFEW